MKKLIILLLVLLTIGTVTASEIDNQLTTPSEYGNFENGCATYTTNSHRIFFVEQLYDSGIHVYFENDTGYVVKPVGDNIYYFEIHILTSMVIVKLWKLMVYSMLLVLCRTHRYHHLK